MSSAEKRIYQRYKVAILAHISDQGGGEPQRCLIRDASLSGCRVVSRHMPFLPDLVSLRVPDVKEIIDGRIAWRHENMAGVQFLWDSVVGERRSRMRRNLNITVSVHDIDDNFIAEALVTDANTDGCRIEASNTHHFPDIAWIKVSGLIKPVKARVSWREPQAVGIEFLWHNDYYVLNF